MVTMRTYEDFNGIYKLKCFEFLWHLLYFDLIFKTLQKENFEESFGRKTMAQSTEPVNLFALSKQLQQNHLCPKYDVE